MTCDRLVCANCSGPVAEGRCAVCRANRTRLHQQSSLGALTPASLAVLLAVLVAVALLVHQTG